MRFEFRTERLGTPYVDLVNAVEIVVDFVETAEVLQQNSRSFLANAGYALDVVDGVSREREEVRNLLGPDAERIGYLLVAQFAFAREVPEYILFRQELRQVLVATDDRRRTSVGTTVLNERADQVIGFVSRARALHHAERPHKAAALLELTLELFWRRVTIRLVLGIDLRAKRLRKALVKKHGNVFWRHLFHEVAHEATETI